MPTYTLRRVEYETDDRIVYYVEGTDGDGDPFTAIETELKHPRAPLEEQRAALADAIAAFPADGNPAVRAALEASLALVDHEIGATP